MTETDQTAQMGPNAPLGQKFDETNRLIISQANEELPVLATLHPTENLALTVARSQVERGDNPPINVTAVLVAALDRISGRSDWTLDD